MGRYTGDNATITVDGTELEFLVSFDIKESTALAKATALGDTAQVHIASNKPEWSGSMTVRHDWAATAQATLRAGTEFAFAGYSETDATGKKYFSGTAIVTEWSASGIEEGSPVGVSFSFTGTGALSIQTVT